MSRSILTFVIVATLCLFAPRLVAQQPPPQHPDFTGMWRVDHVETSADRGTSERRDRGGFGGGFGGRYGRGARGGRYGGRGGYGGRQPDARDGADDARRAAQGLRQGDTLRIRQTADRLILTMGGDTDAQMISYALDGKETKNKLSDDLSVKTKAKWDGMALVTDNEQSIATGRSNVTRKVHEILSLTDPDTLTVQSTSETRLGKRTTTATLKKMPE